VRHVRPLEICEHGVVETVGNARVLAAPLPALFTITAALVDTVGSTRR
jgi:hypothetical protein